MSFQPRPVYLADSLMLPVGKYNGHHRPALSFFELVDQLSPLVQKHHTSLQKIGCIIVGSQNPFAFSGIDNVAAKISGRLGISGAKSILVDTASSSGASAFEAAYLEVASGQHDQVLAIGIQKMTDATTAAATRIVAGVIDREEAEYGLTMPACGALVARSLMEEFNLSEDQWTSFSARLTERAHHYAAQNPDAHLNYEIPVDTYFADITSGKNYLYYDPLHYYDFCPMSDGVAACLLTAAPSAVRVSGIGSGTDIPTIADRLTFTSFPATRIALTQALDKAKLSSLDQLAGSLHINMHDPFNGFGPINLVDLGVIPRSLLLEGLLDNNLTGPTGRFPTNLTGGLKGRGHPLGATGMVQIVENHRFLTSGRYQAALSHSIGGPINNNVVVLLETERSFLERQPTTSQSGDEISLGRLKPAGMSLETVLGEKQRCVARLLAKTSRHNFRSGDIERTLLLISVRHEKHDYRFLIGIDPQAATALDTFAAGDKILLQQMDEQLHVNDVPIRRLYRKTIEGMVDLADSAFRHLGLKK
ncbi:thiolase family protein [Pelovirga terrestris]|uniref:Thiolase family protein n=1 Tax=Pelovirga terrestris TaxID=2771352 RepID=A0A8J6R5Q8_9BACT|nr:thiolase family protein [Pelovirga terrestris]MBD1400539.1 thiolase family protein [Pelovirga terrestris]